MKPRTRLARGLTWLWLSLAAAAAVVLLRRARLPRSQRPARGPRIPWHVKMLLRFPPLLYRVGLAERAGRRFLLLTTIGRKSGRPVTCGLNYVLEGDNVYVFAGFGTTSHWHRNLLANPAVEVQIGTRRFTGRAVPIEDAAERRRLVSLLTTTAKTQGPPEAIRPLLRLIGFDYDAELRESVEKAESIPAVGIKLSEKGHEGEAEPKAAGVAGEIQARQSAVASAAVPEKYGRADADGRGASLRLLRR